MENGNETRIHEKTVSLDSEKIKKFWNERLNKDSSIKSVLLGSGLGENSGVLRNQREIEIVASFLEQEKPLDILDIGCGVGRWATNLLEAKEFKNLSFTYTGLDFSERVISVAQKTFSNKKNIEFFIMSVTGIDNSVLKENYDVIFVNGVLTYVNDTELGKVFSKVEHLLKNKGFFYFQESISILDHRLTLKDFESTDLGTLYNAIYRTTAEYEEYISKYIPNFSCLKSEIMLTKEQGAREETNARYWILSKNSI